MVQRCEARRRPADQLPVDARGAGASTCPAAAKRYIAENDIKLYTHQRHRLGHRDRHGQAHQHHPAVRLLHAGQASCPQEDAIQYMKDAATKSYAKKGARHRGHEPQGHRRRRHGLRARWTCPPAWDDAEDDARDRRHRWPSRARWSCVTNVMEPVGPHGRRHAARVRLRGLRGRPVPAGCCGL